MQGRLMGKRLDAEFFLEEHDAGHAVEGCNYLLALEMEMDPVPGYAIASWERGYGDFGLRPDLGDAAPDPVARGDGDGALRRRSGTTARRSRPSPRQVLKAQVEKARALGFEPMFGSELEFFLFRESYEEAHAKHYHDLTPSVPYILDYHILAASYDEPFLRAMRTAMKAAGMSRRVVEGRGVGRPARDQLPLRGRAARPPTTTSSTRPGSRRSRTSAAARSRSWRSRTTTWVGSSCHIHSSLWRDGENAFAGESDLFRHYLAGQIACARRPRDLLRADRSTRTSASRPAAGRRRRSRGATTTARAASASSGTARPLRPETRIPGADANPYLAFAALLAAGLYGIEQKLELGPAFEGNAYESDVERFPHALREAIARLESSTRRARSCSATRWSTTTSTTRAPSRSCSTRP